MTQPCRSSRGHSTSPEGGGVIWDGMPFETPVIPAKAGIQSFDGAFPKLCRADSRFRGNDCGLFATSLPREEGEECHLRQKNRSVLPHSTTPTRAQGLERRQLGVYWGSARMPNANSGQNGQRLILVGQRGVLSRALNFNPNPCAGATLPRQRKE